MTICCLNPDCPKPLNPDGANFCHGCGIELISLLRGRYRVMQPLGGGGFGRTYLAEDMDKLDERCVLKQLAPQVQGSWGRQKAIELFEQEARRLQQLGEHPQIPTLYAYFKEGNYLYLVQQFIDGQNLLEELLHLGKLDEEKIRNLLKDLLPIIQLIHEQKVIHRDIKPANLIRRQSDGRIVLIDFGVAKQITATVMAPGGTTIGSFGYAPIEQMDKGEVYPASDLYSLGATCFHLLTSIHPWELWKKQGYGWIDRWQQHLPEPISKGLERIIDRLLKEDNLQRYQSATAALQDVNQLPPIQTKLTANLPKLGTWEVIPRVGLAGAGSWFVAIALFSFLGTIWLSSGLWLLVLAGAIFWQSRPLIEKIYVFGIAVITTAIVHFLLFQTLQIANPFQDGVKGFVAIALLVVVAGLLAASLAIISQLFNKLVSK
jgi:serine/threonine protein kinase